ncbi:MAG: 2-oxoacid:acceptor oxidoreductase family protein [bacterium]|jgi:2-oxoacid:acceptor oxidoreductase gamma subunit (pyruvate/2-ketoisovalerate family)
MKEIIFYGRGGQGAVTAANLIVQAAFLEGKYGSAYPSFGAERRGAVVNGYARIDDKPINVHQQIYNPDIVVVLDKKILQMTNVLNGLKDNGVVILNSDKVIEDFLVPNGRLFIVDATRICQELGLIISGWAVVNTAILGSLAKATNIVSIDSIIKTIEQNWKESIAKKNIDATIRAYNETYEVIQKQIVKS